MTRILFSTRLDPSSKIVLRPIDADPNEEMVTAEIDRRVQIDAEQLGFTRWLYSHAK